MATIELSKRPLLVLVGAIVFHIVLISAQVNTAAGIPFIQVVTFGAFSEVQRGTMKGIDSVRGLWTGYVALRDAQTQNEALQREVQTLQVRLQEERAQAQRTEGLRQLLELRERVALETTAAEIIAVGPDPEFRTMTIDKGTTDGLGPDMAVVSPGGVVGRVIVPSLRAAKVQMLIDPNAAAGGLIERTRVQGIVIGQGESLRMDYVPGTADVKAGDVVVTSGIDQIYPKGFLIGTVESVSRGTGTYHQITVKPSVDFSRLEEALVVTTPHQGKAAEQEIEKTQKELEKPKVSPPSPGPDREPDAAGDAAA
jgi:rod shape-determining protein MreC